MIKLIKYAKPFLVSILAIVALLFVQAQTELALPDFMSDIVDRGIQSGGIEHGVPDAIRESEFNKLAIFLDEDGTQLFKDNYTFVEAGTGSSEEVAAYPALANENMFILKEVDESIIDQLNTVLPEAELMVSGIQQQITAVEAGTVDPDNAEMQEFAAMLAQLPPNVSIWTALEMMPEEAITEMKTNMLSGITLMGDSIISTSSASYVKAEYTAIGIDVEQIETNYIMISGIKMLAIALLSSFCAILVGLLSSRVAAGMSRSIRGDVFKKVENFSNAEFNKFSTASLITRTTNDVQQVQMVIVMVLRIVIYAPIIGFGALMKVLNSSASMTWIIALVIAVILGLIMTIFTFAMPKFKIAQKLLDRMNLVMREFLEGMPVIRAFNTQKYEEKKFDKANNDITKTNLFVNRLMSAMMPIMMFVMNGVALLIMWFGGKQMDLGNLQIGEVMAFIQYSMQIIMSFLMISMISIMLPRASVAGARIYEVLSCEPSVNDPEEVKEFNHDQRGFIDFEHVSFRYPGAEEDVLHDINFTAKPGETTAFIGSTGSGKSTIINLVPRFYDVSSGSVKVDGVDIRDVKQHELREKIGYVPQKGVLFTGTIESNLRYAKEDATPEELLEASRIAQASEFIESTPEHYETPISQGGTNVSGGQKQRLSIARALVKQPEIYIFDDSFSALDFKTDAKLRKALNELTTRTKSTVLLVAQRISSIMHADRIVVLDKGVVVGIGTHQELMKSCEVYQEIAYSQLSKEELGDE